MRVRFWAAHNIDIDGRIADWPNEGLIPIGASEVTVIDGDGLDLLRPTVERTKPCAKGTWLAGRVGTPNGENAKMPRTPTFSNGNTCRSPNLSQGLPEAFSRMTPRAHILRAQVAERLCLPALR